MSFSIVRYKQSTIILNFLNSSFFTYETDDIKLAYIWFLIVLYDFEKLTSYLLLNNQNF